MGIISEAQRAFPRAKIPHEEEYYRTVIAACADIYKGEPPWAYVKRSGLYGKGERRMSMLGGAKVLCDSLAALTFSSQADIYCADHRQQGLVERVLQGNGFWENMPSFFSRAYALGGGALKVFIDGDIGIDYISADSFIPVGGFCGSIKEGIFRSRFYKGGEAFTLLSGRAQTAAAFSRTGRCFPPVTDILGSRYLWRRCLMGFRNIRSMTSASRFSGTSDLRGRIIFQMRPCWG